MKVLQPPLGILVKLYIFVFDDSIFDLLQIQGLYLTLIYDGVQRIPHLVRDRRVDQTQHFVLCFLVVEKDLLGNVEN